MNASAKLTASQITEKIVQSLEDLPFVHAVWEGGAAAFERLDEWSDIDLMVDVDDERVQEAFEAIEQALQSLSPIELQFEIPQPTWHGHAQRFYRLKDASKYQVLDVAVMKHSNQNKFLQVEQHGRARVHFDRSGVVQPPRLDRQALLKRLVERLATLRVTFDLFQVLMLKELNRGNDIEALAFYQSFTLRPLVEVLRIRHQPARHDFYTRYIYYDLPESAVKKLHELFFLNDREDLLRKRRLAEEWFYETLQDLEVSPPSLLE